MNKHEQTFVLGVCINVSTSWGSNFRDISDRSPLQRISPCLGTIDQVFAHSIHYTNPRLLRRYWTVCFTEWTAKSELCVRRISTEMNRTSPPVFFKNPRSNALATVCVPYHFSFSPGPRKDPCPNVHIFAKSLTSWIYLTNFHYVLSIGSPLIPNNSLYPLELKLIFPLFIGFWMLPHLSQTKELNLNRRYCIVT